ncbi:hypothetical protein PISL3812_07157 [Talaromyces islandicus]|uniref:Uncharacterized protein n=1 Tax=Talaromyces islandicus TaxID=28573 RepID=A0A0U1M552_TALIS|nr:hypothetical protein PISL3812_07157 [Talaromyces islandicus]
MSDGDSAKRISIVLKSSKDWRPWIKEIKRFAERRQLWEQVNPDASPEAMDTSVSFPNKASEIYQVSNLLTQYQNEHGTTAPREVDGQQIAVIIDRTSDITTQLDKLKALDLQQRLFQRQHEAKLDLMSAIEGSLEKSLKTKIDSTDEPKEALRILKREVAYSEERQQMILLDEFDKLREGKDKNTKVEDWAARWETFHDEAVAANLLEATGIRLYIEFVKSTKNIMPEFYMSWITPLFRISGLTKEEQKRENLPRFSQFISDFKNQYRSRPQEPRGRGAMAFASLQGQSDLPGINPLADHTNNQERSDSNSREYIPLCPCGKREKYRDCEYLIVDNRPANWKPEPKIIEAFQRHFST